MVTLANFFAMSTAHNVSHHIDHREINYDPKIIRLKIVSGVPEFWVTG